jgi:hypothetical protein
VTLLNYPDNERGRAAFSFDHAHEHGKLTDAMNQPTLFNLAHYLLDPVPPSGMGGSEMWSLNHQQAHDDAANYYSVQPSLQLVDTPSQDTGPWQWFLFTNSQEHNALSLAALRSGFAS